MTEQVTPELNPKAIVRSPSGTLYFITGVLGAGGFGITYSAVTYTSGAQNNTTHNVALKEHFIRDLCGRNATTNHVDVHSHNTGTYRRALRDFIGEAKRLKSIANHPSIVTVSEVFEANSTAYYAMELINGMSLAEMIDRRGPLSEQEMIDLMLPVIDAVALLHRQRITHLDIKPANIMIERDSNRPILIDFGLSKHYNEDGTPTSTINTQGLSAGYAPPEQYAGITSFSPASDIYALAATIYFCLTGKNPPPSINIRPQDLHSLLSINMLPHIREILERAFEYSAQDRIPDGDTLLRLINDKDKLDDLFIPATICDDSEITLLYSQSATPSSRKQPESKAKKSGLKKSILLITMAIITITITTIAGLFILRKYDTSAQSDANTTLPEQISDEIHQLPQPTDPTESHSTTPLLQNKITPQPEARRSPNQTVPPQKQSSNPKNSNNDSRTKPKSELKSKPTTYLSIPQAAKEKTKETGEKTAIPTILDLNYDSNRIGKPKLKSDYYNEATPTNETPNPYKSSSNKIKTIEPTR